MGKKYLTERLPFLLPLRKKQRCFFFYAKMRFDRNHYAKEQCESLFPVSVFSSRCPMYNRETGFPMEYQENKVFNLKLAAARLDRLVIGPGETFSFWHAVRNADKPVPYREALAEVNGRLVTQYGGGLCQISNLLFWLFLHTRLTLTERHGHSKKDFPEPPSDAPLGVDATVAEGWLDLRVKNETDHPMQISITFDGEAIVGEIRTRGEPEPVMQILNRNLRYIRTLAGVIEEVDVIRQIQIGSAVSEVMLYRNRCRISYPLPPETEMV